MMVMRSEGIDAFESPAPGPGDDGGKNNPVPAPMRIHMERHAPDTIVIQVRGEVDDDAVPRLGEFLRQRLSGFVSTVVIDLSEVAFFNSAALELICEAQQRASEREIRMAVVSGGTGWFDRLLRLSGLEKRIACFDSVPAALSGSTSQ